MSNDVTICLGAVPTVLIESRLLFLSNTMVTITRTPQGACLSCLQLKPPQLSHVLLLRLHRLISLALPFHDSTHISIIGNA